jgi:hypothetical protein
LVLLGAALAVLVGLLNVLGPQPTVLNVRVLDAETGKPLPGAIVSARILGAEPLPRKTTDEEGVARFEGPLANGAYRLHAQRADFELCIVESVEVLDGQETESTLSLAPKAGGRLYVGLKGSLVAEIDTASLLLLRTSVLRSEEWEWVKHLVHHPSEDLLYCTVHQAGYILDSHTGATLGELQIGEPVRTLYINGDGRYLLAEGIWTEDQLLIDAHSGERQPLQALEDAQIDPYDYMFRRPRGVEAYEYGLRLEDGMEASETWESLVGYLVRGERINATLMSARRRWYTLPAQRMLTATNGRTLYAWTRDAWDPERHVELHVVEAGRVPVVNTTFSLPFSISAIAVSPARSQVYALDVEMHTLTIISVADHEPRKLVPVGKEPVALVVSADGTEVYVANRESRTISVVQLPSGKLNYNIPVPGEPVSMALR